MARRSFTPAAREAASAPSPVKTMVFFRQAATRASTSSCDPSRTTTGAGSPGRRTNATYFSSGAENQSQSIQ
jgi:hypothetical protein